jgi:CO/xanthine dehydrogenase FAD-binding subunit
VVTFSGGKSAEAMIELGFVLKNSMYVHPLTPFTVEFPPGPLAIGDDYSIKYQTLRDGEMVLNVIHPTDCVLDRFAAYVHWKDRGSLRSAALVAAAIGDQLDWKRIEDWCAAEGVSDKVAHLKAEMEAIS